METTIITIGVTLMKMAVLGGLGSGIITGVKWFGKFDPKLKGKGGVKDDSDPIEHLRQRVR